MLVRQKNIILQNNETRAFLADAYYMDEKNNLPLLVFAHGYKGYKDWGAWDLMAEAFAKAGFFFVKFNFSYNGTKLDDAENFSDLEAFGHNNFSTELSDYSRILDYFGTHPFVDPEKIYVMGHSRGGSISVIAAQQERVKKLVTISAMARLDRMFPSGSELSSWEKKGVFYSQNKRTEQEMPNYFQLYEDFEVNKDLYSIQKRLEHFDKPYLILHGGKDELIPVVRAHKIHSWCKSSRLEILEDSTHTFGAKEPWNEPKMPDDLAIAVEKTIAFLKE